MSPVARILLLFGASWCGACFYVPPTNPPEPEFDTPPFSAEVEPTVTVDLGVRSGAVKFTLPELFDANPVEEIRYRFLLGETLIEEIPIQEFGSGTLRPAETQGVDGLTVYAGPTSPEIQLCPLIRLNDGELIRSFVLELEDPIPAAQGLSIPAYTVRITWRIDYTGRCES